MVSASTQHEDTLLVEGVAPRNLTDEHLTEHRAGGVDAFVNTVTETHDATFEDAVLAIRDAQQRLAEYPNATQVCSVDDIRTQGEISVVFGFQNTTALERNGDPNNVSIFAQLGVRVIGLTYNARNWAGNGCTERVDDGISKFGLSVIDALESNDILLDLSHAGPRTASEALDASSQPVVFSHSNAKSLHDHPRNISDELITSAADTGGVVGIAAYAPLVSDDVTLDDYVDHIEYVVDLVGINHVALGCDLGGDTWDTYPQLLIDDPDFPDIGGPRRVPDLVTYADMPNLTVKLVERGFSRESIEAIMGENLLRVYEEVWGA